MPRRPLCLGALLVLAAGLAFGAGPAGAERSQSGNLIVFLNGGIAPRKLPRDHAAPVAVRLSGGIETTDGSALPRVRRIALALAWRGVLDTRGLPICPRARLRSVDNRQARQICGGALVGRGRLFARVFLPGQEPFGIRASLLAFNGKTKGGAPALWVHAYTADPPASFVLPFHVRHQSGPFKTVLVTTVPRSVGPWPHFARFQITVRRRFGYEGSPHSYLSASCPVPNNLTAGFLSFAHATFEFVDGREMTQESVRGCRVRE